MHQRLHLPRHIPIIDEEILLDPERHIVPLQIARPISLHSLPQNQILRPGWRPNRIGLHESHPRQRPPQRRRRKERPRHREPPQIIEGQMWAGHAVISRRFSKGSGTKLHPQINADSADCFNLETRKPKGGIRKA